MLTRSDRWLSSVYASATWVLAALVVESLIRTITVTVIGGGYIEHIKGYGRRGSAR